MSGQNQAVATALQPSGGVGYLKLDANGNLLVSVDSAPSSEVTPVSADSGNKAATAAVAAIPGAAGKTSYVSGFQITGAGATAASVVVATLAGVLGGTKSFVIPVPAGVTLGITPLNVVFDPPLPASAVNTAITLTVPSLGSGNTNAAASINGFQQ